MLKLYATPAVRPVAVQLCAEKVEVPSHADVTPEAPPGIDCNTVQLVKEQPVPVHAEGATHATIKELNGTVGLASTDREVGTDPSVAMI